ncbi:peroxidasin homolog [Ruditapes philippinarum]|uniref:peroxidasin homolog n=1 Tax=Ruditapes philippinarum TaxID=129788 RepID=UPI00295A8671|nr:peroxidasin homolog [Ruditapes philippinarum]
MIASYRNGSTIHVLETELLKLTCSVTGGKPLATLRMTCLNSNSTATVTKETTVTVYIALQVNRNHSQCICQSDHMISGTQKTYVMLDVLFQPREVRFGMEAGESLIVNQNEEVTFQCFAESNPHPDIVIRNQRDEQIIMMEYATHDVQHTIPKVSCADAGEYVCSARNMLTNGQGALSRLSLIVRCRPRPSADTVKETKITALLHVDVTLQFLAQDFFDEQNKTAFAWYKQKVPIQNDGNKYIISSYGLQSNLIIRNITYSDYGQYQVVVRNSFGHNTYYYELLEKAPQHSTEPITASTLFGVTVGVSSFTFLVVVLAFLFWIYTRRKRTLKITDRKTAEVINEYQATTRHNDNDAENMYEQIDEQ